MATIRAVFFDVGWTLTYPRASMWEIFADLCTSHGVPTAPQACEQLIRALSRATQEQAVARVQDGATYADSDDQFAALFEQMATLVFSQFGVHNGHGELQQEFFARFWNEDNWCLFPDVLDVLAEVRRRGMRVGALSNAPSNLLQFLDRLGITPHLDFAVVSAIEGVKKPDRRIFAAALSRAGVAPHEALHVGDMYVEDIVGGRAAGVNTLLMERGPYALFPSFRESEGRPLEPGNVVTNLAEVLARVA